jgi:hypothetical protein
VHLVQDLPPRLEAFPGVIGPAERGRIDDDRRTVRSVWLKARNGIGPELVGIQTVPIPRAGPDPWNEGFEVPLLRVLERVARAAVDDELHAAARRRPHTSVRAVLL